LASTGLKGTGLYIRWVPKSPRKNFLVEIQALRALAVLFVVLFHLWPDRLPGGFAGVDVFFVISGFLITGHLLREVDKTGSVNVFAFWARRLRRLLPASLLVLAATLVAIFVFVPYNLWQSFLQSVLGSALYVENWVLAANSVNYWTEGQTSPPSQHYWSLSVEEQFYVIWPLIIIAALVILTALKKKERSRGVLKIVMAVVFVASLGYSVYETSASQAAAYFVTPTRVWEFALGGLVAILALKRPSNETLRSAISWFGLGMVVLSGFVLSSTSAFPGWIALLPTVGTALVIWMGAPVPRWSIRPIASFRPVQFIGDISYSMYLWHWPFIVILPWIIGHAIGDDWKIAIFIATILLAWGTKRYVEDTLRSSKPLMRYRSVPTYAATALAMALVVAVAAGGMSYQTSWATNELKKTQQLADNSPSCFGAASGPTGALCSNPALSKIEVPDPNLAAQDFDPDVQNCFSQDPNPNVIECHFGDPKTAKFRIAVVGDSHAGAIVPAVRRLVQNDDWYADVFLKPGCPWSQIDRIRTDGFTAAIGYCRGWETKVTNDLVAAKPYDAILTTAYTVVSNLVQPKDGKDSYDTSVAALVKTWSEFEAKRPQTPIVVLRDGPNWPNQSPVDCLIQAQLKHQSDSQCTVSRQDAFAIADPQIDAVKQVPGAHLIDLTDHYCGPTSCPAVMGGVTLYQDQHHFTRTFSQTLAPYLKTAIDNAISSHKSAGGSS
jgi:peptidoglycan/LPS O-acetylase OafA/YrhL